MNQAYLIFKKDLRHLWPVLSVLLALWFLHLWIVSRDPLAGNFTTQSISRNLINTAESVLILFLWLMHLIIAVQVVQEDPLPGTSHFWLTRPVSKGALLASKGGFVLVFLLGLPLAANLIVLLRYGMETRNIPACMLAAFAPYLAVLLLSTAVAAMTRNVAGVVVIFVSGAVLLFAAAMLSFGSYNPPRANDTFLIVAVVVLSLIVIGRQYRTRRTVRSAAIFAIGALVIFCSYRWMNWDFRPNHPAVMSDAKPEFERIGMAFRKDVRGQRGMLYQVLTVAGNTTVPVVIKLSDMPPDCTARLVRLKGTLQFGDGTGKSFDFTGTSSYRNPKSFPPAQPEDLYVAHLRVEEAFYKNYGNEPGILSGEAEFRIAKYVTEARIPVKKGASFQTGSLLLTVNEIPGFLLEARGRYLDQDGENSYLPLLYVAGQNRGEMVSSRGPYDYHMLFPLESVLRYFEKRWPIDPAAPDGVSGAEILVVRRTEAGGFTRRFEVKDFRMADYMD